jgi:hypothetical protein
MGEWVLRYATENFRSAKNEKHSAEVKGNSVKPQVDATAAIKPKWLSWAVGEEAHSLLRAQIDQFTV